MGKSNCAPQSVYGPYRQTLFLGCSVLSFSATAGWNGESSSVTVEIAPDPCNSPPGHYKAFWAGHGVYVTEQQWTGPDPGFTFPNMGAPVYFRVADFEYSGLIQGWTVKEDPAGKPVYTVKLVDPRIILDNAQVILDSYEGGHQGLYNLFNVYGYLESTAANCSDVTVNGAKFGAPAQGFGGARRTARGLPWDLIKAAVQDLAGNIGGVSSDWSQGGLFYRGTSGGGWGELNYGIHPAGARYVLDLEEVPNSYTWDYRITGPVVSISDLINQVCQDAGCDYYVELLPTGTSLIIKVRTISRTNQPALGTSEIQGFITANNILLGGNGIVSDSFGRELRSEVNSSFLIGAKGRQLYQELDSNNMTPFWGWDADGNLLQSEFGGGKQGWSVDLDLRKVNLILYNPVTIDVVNGTYGTVYENEMRYSLGDYETFISKILTMQGPDCPTVIQQYYRDTLGIKINDVRNRDPGQMDDRVAIDGLVGREGGVNDGSPTNPKVVDGKTFFNWLQSYVQDFWGKKFLVLCPNVCSAIDVDTQETIYSDEPSTEGAWTVPADNTPILGITNPSVAADFFKDDAGKVQPLLKYVGSGLNLKALNQDDYIVRQMGGVGTVSTVWLKASVDPKWVEGTPVKGVPDAGKLSALLTIQTPILDGEGTQPIESNSKLMDAKPRGAAKTPDAVTANKLGATGETVGAVGAAVAYPGQAGVPLVSNTRTYGPWFAVGANPGAVTAEVDDGLAPWEYGGTLFMNAAGLAKVKNAVTAMQVGERGEVTIPGYPTLSLGSSLQANSPMYRYEGRSLGVGSHAYPSGPAIYHFVAWALGQQTAGASISSINVTVGAGGVTTSYTISTFTPVFGRFAKDNAERLKRIGLNRLKTERDLRAKTALNRLLAVAQNMGKAGGGGGGASSTRISRNATDDIGKGALSPKNEPGIWFAGTLSETDPKRKTVLVPTKTTTPYYTGYPRTAFTSMDGILRPVSNYGDADLPKVAPNSGDCTFRTIGPPGPISDSSAGGGYTGLPIVQKYLDYLADAVSNPTFLGDKRTSTSTSGHDIESVARKDLAWLSGNQPGGTDSLFIHISGNNSFADDYRHFALRGPLLIHGWGYDLYGKPIPNAAFESDSKENGWQDNYSGLKDEFKENWLSDARDWPVAPVDLRFDRARGVWTIPPALRMYRVFVDEQIDEGQTGIVSIEGAEALYAEDGSLLTDPKIQVINLNSASLQSGDRGLAYYDTVACEYIFIGGGGGGVSAACSDREVPPVFNPGFPCGQNTCDPCQYNVLPPSGWPTGPVDGGLPPPTQNDLFYIDECMSGLNDRGTFVGNPGTGGYTNPGCPDLNNWEFIEWGYGLAVTGQYETDSIGVPSCGPTGTGLGRRGLLVAIDMDTQDRFDSTRIQSYEADLWPKDDISGLGALQHRICSSGGMAFLDTNMALGKGGGGWGEYPSTEGGMDGWPKNRNFDGGQFAADFIRVGAGLFATGIPITCSGGPYSGWNIPRASGVHIQAAPRGIFAACTTRRASGCGPSGFWAKEERGTIGPDGLPVIIGDEITEGINGRLPINFIEWGHGFAVSGVRGSIYCNSRDSAGNPGEPQEGPPFGIPQLEHCSGLLVSVDVGFSGLGIACSERKASGCDQFDQTPKYDDGWEFVEFGGGLEVSGIQDGKKSGVLVSAASGKLGVACSDGFASGCGGFTATPKYTYDFIEFGSGLNVLEKTAGGGKGVLVSIAEGVSGSGGGGRGEGFMKIGTTGCPSFCGGESGCFEADCIVFGTGLCVTSTGHPGASGARSYTVTGPVLDGVGATGNPVYDAGFYRLSFGDQLTLDKTGECWYTVNTSSGTMKVGSTGCAGQVPCTGKDCIIFGTGLSWDATTNIVTGPTISDINCDNSYVDNDLLDLPFQNILLGTGLTLKRDISPVEKPPSGRAIFPTGDCTVWINSNLNLEGTHIPLYGEGAVDGPFGVFEALKFNKGLKVTSGEVDSSNLGCAFTIDSHLGIQCSTEVATECDSVILTNSPNEYNVEYIEVGSGLGVRPVSSIGMSGILISLTGAGGGGGGSLNVGSQGCGTGHGCTANFPCEEVDCIIFSTGLCVSKTPTGVIVTGPSIAGKKAGGGFADGGFTRLVFGSGLTLDQTDPCHYTVHTSGIGSSVKISSQGCSSYCSGTTPCTGVECIVFGTGLCVDGNVVSGPVLDGISASGSGLYDKGFYRLTFGSGLTLDETGECWYTVKTSGADLTVSSTGCDDPGDTSANIGHLVFRSGIRATVDNGVATIDAFQKWKTRATHAATPLSAIPDSVGSDTCPAGPFECIGVGTGLAMEDEGDCEALISWNGLDYRVSGCEPDPQISRTLGRARSICFGSGFGYMAQTNTPAAARLDVALTAGPHWADHDGYLCANYPKANNQVACAVTGMKGLDVRISEGAESSTIFLAPNVHQFTEDTDRCTCADNTTHTQMLELGIGLEKIGSESSASACKTLIAKNLTVGGVGDYITNIKFDAIDGCTTLQAQGDEACGGSNYKSVKVGTIGITRTFEVVTGIVCSGDQLVAKSASLSFCNGLLQGFSA